MLAGFNNEELFILSDGLLRLIEDVNKAKELVHEDESRVALDEELKIYRELHSKLLDMCK